MKFMLAVSNSIQCEYSIDMLIWRRIIAALATTKLVDQHTRYRTRFLRGGGGNKTM